MASLVFSVVGGAAGAAFGPAGAIVGRIAGAVVGSMLDRAMFSQNSERTHEGPRLSDLDVMASSEGEPVPRVYGRSRLSGQVIWATLLQEVVTTEVTQSGGDSGGGGGSKGFGGGGGGSSAVVTTTSTTYTYFANFAVGICEGTIGGIGRIWADGKPLDRAKFNIRIYRGSETQTPDRLMVAWEGAANVPAYRGLAYIVFERMPLAQFGNRIPQLSFEVLRPVGRLERMTKAITLTPGSTEFGYEPSTIVRVFGPGQFGVENRHIASAASDVVASLDELQAMCPNLEHVSIVTSWFGTDLRAGFCAILPGVDNVIKQTSPHSWSVAGLARSNAYQVSQIEGRAAFGGTPTDSSILNLIAELKRRGLKVTLYPFLIMDIAAGNSLPDPWTGASGQPLYPWRGRITCSPAPGTTGTVQGTSAAGIQVNQFFTGGTWNYRRMILHYAQLCSQAGGVDAIVIGSELKSLTRVRSESGAYPAVAALVTLAADVKAIVGSTLVTYAADWTEYGADVLDADAQDVRFPLDPLWASEHVDAVGLDYYAPLSDWRDDAGHKDGLLADSIYDAGYLAGNLASGEGYDWYYASPEHRAAQERSLITDGAAGKPWVFRVKDIWNWWSQPHVERRDGIETTATAWVPQSKPIWLTELGCPAVDKGPTQPNVFPDEKSSEGSFPYFSTGMRDDLTQRRYLEAVLDAFDPAFGATASSNPVSSVYDGRMLDPSRVYLWCWDARPYPVFPAAADAWGDVDNWHCGHWLNGRLGGAPLDGLVETLLADCGVHDVDCSQLIETCEGYVVDRPMSARAMIEPLAAAYAFDTTVINGQMQLIPRGGRAVAELSEDDLVEPSKGAALQITRAQESELPVQTGFSFSDVFSDYRRSAVTSRRLVGASHRMSHSELAVVTHDSAAIRRAEVLLQDLWAGRERASFSLGRRRLDVTTGDVVALTAQGRRYLFNVESVTDTHSREISARRIDPSVFSSVPEKSVIALPMAPLAAGPVNALTLDLPIIARGEPVTLTWLAVSAKPWTGPAAVWRSLGGTSFEYVGRINAPTPLGVLLDDLPQGPINRWDMANSFRVRMSSGGLSSKSDDQIFAGANAAAVRTSDTTWEILQFAIAELVDDQTWRLSRLLRGQSGSAPAMHDLVSTGQPFVLLGPHMMALARGTADLGREMNLRVVPAGTPYDDPIATPLSVLPGPVALLPPPPVYPRASRSEEGILFSWTRQARVDADSWELAEIPLGEPQELYRLHIMNDGEVIRTFHPSEAQ